LSNSKILIRGGEIIDPRSPFNGQRKDILIEKGKITKIGSRIKAEKKYQVVEAKGCLITPGLLDLRAQFKDPGKEHKEDIISGAKAAELGGFTGVVLQPTTDPVTQTKSGVHYVRSHSQGVLSSIYTCGAATADLLGDEISEMFDMHSAGAVAFSNGDRPFHNSGVLMRALLYCQSFDGLIMTHSEDKHLAANGSVNESESTIGTGLKKRPPMAEYIQVEKELNLLRYTGGRLHFSHISTEQSVAAIRKAKKEGLRVSCDVSIWNLVFNDEKVKTFDSNYKLLPPLRMEKDRKALVKGLKDGTIDAIVSDHNPQNIERKKVEFDYAAFGNSSLQTVYSIYNELLSSELDPEQFVQRASIGPRELLGLELATIDVDKLADLAIFDPNAKWTLNARTSGSKTGNNPFFGNELKGKCIYIQNGDRYAIHE